MCLCPPKRSTCCAPCSNGAPPSSARRSCTHGRIWPDTFVVDANLNVLIGEIRRTLADDAQRPLFIRTVHGIGYAFCAEAADAEPLDEREVVRRAVLRAVAMLGVGRAAHITAHFTRRRYPGLGGPGRGILGELERATDPAGGSSRAAV